MYCVVLCCIVHMLFISPPFGNYYHRFCSSIFSNQQSSTCDKNILPICGSFTVYPRPGLLSQIFKTLRYSFQHDGWVNKIGLRNPGIHYFLKNNCSNTDKSIISIALLNKDDVAIMQRTIPEHANIELNVSCPNTDKHMVREGLSVFLNDKRKWCIIKLSPLDTTQDIDYFYKQGFRQFHCCNTYPLPSGLGGLSGKYLQPYVLEKIRYIKSNFDKTIVIAGGGIDSIDDVELYRKNGADHFSISTLCFSPIRFLCFYFRWIDKYGI